MVWGAIASAAASLAGGAISDKKNKASAARQQRFQERMSSTAYQRAADDLEAAGLNRILAIGSPASSPSGAFAPVADYGHLVSSGLSAGASMSQAKSASSQASSAAKNAETNAKSQRASEKQIDQAIKKMEAEIGKISTEDKKNIEQLRVMKIVAPIIAKYATMGDEMYEKLREVATEIGEILADDIAAPQGKSKVASFHKVMKKFMPNYDNGPIGWVLNKIYGE